MSLAPSTRAGAFASISRLLDKTGIVRLTRPFLNRVRIQSNAAGQPAFPFLRIAKTPNAQILIYHRINDDRDPYFGGVPTAVFERQVEYLASRFHVLPLSRLVAALRDGSVPDDAVAITFDDGYRDNYTHALPILKRYGVPATIFVTTGAIGSARQLWHDDVFSAFRETKESALPPYAGRAGASPLETTDDRLRAQREFLSHIRTLPGPERSRAIAGLRETLRVGPAPDAPGLMLSWDEVRAMHRAGIEFGSHTVSHPILSRADAPEARREVVESKRAIEEALGTVIEGFAYPNGTRADFLPETKDLLREAGYAYAVTTLPGANEAGCDPYDLRRGTPWDDDVFAFGMRLLYNKLRA